MIKILELFGGIGAPRKEQVYKGQLTIQELI